LDSRTKGEEAKAERTREAAQGQERWHRYQGASSQEEEVNYGVSSDSIRSIAAEVPGNQSY